jgi:hypothetical protein
VAAKASHYFGFAGKDRSSRSPSLVSVTSPNSMTSSGIRAPDDRPRALSEALTDATLRKHGQIPMRLPHKGSCPAAPCDLRSTQRQVTVRSPAYGRYCPSDAEPNLAHSRTRVRAGRMSLTPQKLARTSAVLVDPGYSAAFAHATLRGRSEPMPAQ